ncbi:hypothetical protein K493DRAFT_317431 [Basidiobolus meristosporus CBS 931.73]|uniref:Uncharacterized protein n=1 Tax=Basidiobolus meristosporus CBS 931.73 TaxID=1314790 RepID=A0A1Y1Y0G7_9FUNG|nr:hypothetical protein K493DRAFT_317431 [Basidiobolus meristosporus CBS 931.73]|eukprot:ORX91216.1 hypothetical protein K493DRAFT_317431 [Basidiobolus meristosporus CBS 931.73]
MSSEVLQPRSDPHLSRRLSKSKEERPAELLVFQLEKEKGSDNVVIKKGDKTHYILKRQLFGKKYSLTSGESSNTLIRAVTHRAVGYITLKSDVFAIHFNLSFPKFPRGVYTFEIDGVQYLWDYEMNSHMRCFTVLDTKLVAQIFLNSNPSSPQAVLQNAKLAMVKDVAVSSGALSLIVMTGLLLMKKQIW